MVLVIVSTKYACLYILFYMYFIALVSLIPPVRLFVAASNFVSFARLVLRTSALWGVLARSRSPEETVMQRMVPL
jgi:hypothetical protein